MRGIFTSCVHVTWYGACAVAATHCNWYPTGDVRTHSSRTDRHKVFKLDGGVDYITRHICSLTKVKRSNVKVTTSRKRIGSKNAITIGNGRSWKLQTWWKFSSCYLVQKLLFGHTHTHTRSIALPGPLKWSTATRLRFSEENSCQFPCRERTKRSFLAIRYVATWQIVNIYDVCIPMVSVDGLRRAVTP